MDLKQIIALIAGAILLVTVIIYLLTNQKEKVREWLIYAVSEAEKLLGGNTGQLKLRLVWDWFCDKFPIAAAVLPFKVFSAWVDIALETMRKWLELGNPIGDYIKGGDEK